MFINDEDYKVVVGDQALKVISQVSETNRQNAEAEAIEEMSGYLRPKYDVETVFAQEGDSRNRLVVMYACDIALYHMAASLPQKMGMEIRKERYDRAIKWLTDVQKGNIVPDLPLSVDEEGNMTGGTLRWGSTKPLRHEW